MGGAYLTSCSTVESSAGSDRLTLRMVGGLARVNPVPTAFHPADLKACSTWRPRKPVAPVMSAVLAMVVE